MFLLVLLLLWCDAFFLVFLSSLLLLMLQEVHVLLELLLRETLLSLIMHGFADLWKQRLLQLSTGLFLSGFASLLHRLFYLPVQIVFW